MELSLVHDLIDKKLVHEVHTSERKSFRACRRRWDWIFRDNLYPYLTAKPLEFGIAMHLGYELYYDPNTWSMPRHTIAEYAIKKAVDKSEEQRAEFLKQEAVPYLEDDVKADYDERVDLIKKMLRYYFYQIAPSIDISWTPVKVEIGFMVPIPHPETKEILLCKCAQCKDRWVKHLKKLESQIEYLKEAKSRDISTKSTHLQGGPYLVSAQRINWPTEPNWDTWEGLPVVYAGRCDMLCVDNEGNYWIFDWKSTTTVHVDHDEFLELDDQVMSYVWSLRKLGLPIRGFVYHEQKKAVPEPPKKNTYVRLGRKFSVSKNQNTDYDTYLKTVSEEDKDAYEAGLYDEFLNFLKADGIVFFKRWQIHKSDYQCEQAEYNIGLEALDIIDPGIRVYPSPGRFGCTTCAFRQPCLSQNDGSDYQYTLETLYERREHYYVREEPSTESKGGE